MVITPSIPANLQHSVIEVTSIDRENLVISGKEDNGTTRIFSFRPHTKIRLLSPTERETALNVLLVEQPGDFPIELDQEILVHWSQEEGGSASAVAWRFTLLEPR